MVNFTWLKGKASKEVVLVSNVDGRGREFLKVIALNIVLDVESCAADEEGVSIALKIIIIGSKEVGELTAHWRVGQAHCLWAIVTSFSVIPKKLFYFLNQ